MKKLIYPIFVATLLLCSCSKASMPERVDPISSELTNNKATQTTSEIEAKSNNTELNEKEKTLQPFKDKWEGEITQIREGHIDKFDCTLDIHVEQTKQSVLVSSNVYNVHYSSVDWDVQDRNLTFAMNDEENRATCNLTLTEDKTLTGTYEQYGSVNDVVFNKTSDIATDATSYQSAPNVSDHAFWAVP